MKFWLVLILVATPIVVLLDALRADLTPTHRLPEGDPEESGEPVLQGRDIAGEQAEGAETGRLLQLEGVEIRVVEGSALRTYARFGKLVRYQGRTRITDVEFALFDAGRLELIIKAPFVEGDPRRIVRPKKGERRIAVFGGGVTLLDPAGRELASLQRLSFDLDQNTLSSDSHVILRMAEKGLELEADGIFADLDKQSGFVRLEKNVSGVAPVGDRSAHFSCSGPATITETADSAYHIVMAGDAQIAQPPISAGCQRMEADVRRVGEKQELVRAELTGEVTVDLGQEIGSGVEQIKADRVLVEGEVITLIDNVSAVRRGPIERIGVGDRVLDLRADRARVAPVGTTKEGKRLWDVVVNGLRIRDRHGPGRFDAGRLHINQKTGRFVAEEGLFAESSEGTIAGDRLVAEQQDAGPEEVDLLLEGRGKRLVYHHAGGRLGPFGQGRRGDLVITSTGPLRLARRKGRTTFRTSGNAQVSLAGASSLRCERLLVVAAEKEIALLEAEGKVVFSGKDPAAGIEGDFVSYKGGVVRIRGRPAVAHSAGHGRLEAARIRWQEDGLFRAEGGVVGDVALQRKGAEQPAPWRLRCAEVTGRFVENEPPEFLKARGAVSATGPQGQSYQGESFEFDSGTGEAVLRGKPASARRGKQLALTAPEIRLTVRDRQLAEARTVGKALIDFAGGGKLKPARSGFAHWSFALAGDALLVGDRLTVDKGGRFKVYDERGELRMEGTAGRVVILVKRSDGAFEPLELIGSKGVQVRSHGNNPTTVDARELSYLNGSKKVDVRGNVRIRAKGRDSRISFARAVFVLTKDGVDLKSASDIEVRKPGAKR